MKDQRITSDQISSIDQGAQACISQTEILYVSKREYNIYGCLEFQNVENLSLLFWENDCGFMDGQKALPPVIYPAL